MSILSGKTALVTGGSRGIGAAIAKRLAKDGADVALTYVSKPDAAEAVVAEMRKLGRRAEALQVDAADPASVTKAVDGTAERFGRLDILVNNAGIAKHGTIAEMPLDDFDRIVAVNVRAVFVAAQAAARHMGEGGRIITIGSVNAERVPFAGTAAYAMSKAAIMGLTRGMARDLAADGITVNVVQPGPVETDMNPGDTEFADAMRGLLAIRRYGHPDDIAGAVAYLAAPEAAYVTGIALTVDGGFLI